MNSSQTARSLIAEADQLRTTAARAEKIADGMDVKFNRGHDIGGVTVYSHRGFPTDLAIVEAIQRALIAFAQEHRARADAIDARVGVVA